MLELPMLTGHFWTLKCHVAGRLRPTRLPRFEPWSTTVDDPLLGLVRLTGRLHRTPCARDLLVVVHGLGGSSQSVYVRRAARAALDLGMACLCIDLRGADLSGEDLYHAGLASDLEAALQSPELASYSRVSVFGYSLGGHVALRLAALTRCPRLHSVIAVCPPLDLQLSAAALDRPSISLYRRHVLAGLKEMYEAFRRRRPHFARIDPQTLASIDRIVAWDEAVVVPRHGFSSAQHYYSEMSAARVLGRITVPTLVVHATLDPMVPIETVRPALSASSDRVRSFESKQGGHVGFPANFSLDLEAPKGLEAQLLAWARAPDV